MHDEQGRQGFAPCGAPSPSPKYESFSSLYKLFSSTIVPSLNVDACAQPPRPGWAIRCMHKSTDGEVIGQMPSAENRKNLRIMGLTRWALSVLKPEERLTTYALNAITNEAMARFALSEHVAREYARIVQMRIMKGIISEEEVNEVDNILMEAHKDDKAKQKAMINDSTPVVEEDV